MPQHDLDHPRFDARTDLSFDDEPDAPRRRRGRPRLDDDELPAPPRRRRPAPPTRDIPDLAELPDLPGVPDGADRWTTWQGAMHGPLPRPAWVIPELGAVDTELGVLKTGKEADVHLLERSLPGTDRSVRLAAKRYRSSEHRMFHRDAGYTEGRRVRRSRETRAMARRTDFGRDLLAGQWAVAEFAALSRLWQIGTETGGIAVPYPVSLDGTELLLEFLGEPDGTAAPRLAQLRPEPEDLTLLWDQLVTAMSTLAQEGLTHGDLSPYNVLVHRGRLVLIDLPQVVDVVGNPQGVDFLARDVQVMATWFAARGLPDAVVDAERLLQDLLTDAGVR